ncbi:MAG: ABC transporter permease [Pseudomonadota bacterium]
MNTVARPLPQRAGPIRRTAHFDTSRSDPKWLYFAAALTLAFLALPMLALFASTSPAHAYEALASQITHKALYLSVVTSTLSTGVVVCLGGLLAYVLARNDFPGRVLVDTLIDTPMVLPPMVTGLALLLFFGRNGPAGIFLAQHGISMSFSTTAVVLAQIFVSLPFFVRAARAGFEGMDRKLEMASLLLGASRLRTFLRVVVPCVWPTLVAGAVLAWARCLGEFGATLVFAGNFEGSTQTMPLAIFSALQDNMQLAVTMSLVLVLVSFALVVLLKVVSARYGTSHAAA